MSMYCFQVGKKLKDQSGAAMAITLLILAMVTLIGLSAATTSNVEEQVSGNDRAYKVEFYRAENAMTTGGRTIDALKKDSLQQGWNWELDNFDTYIETQGATNNEDEFLRDSWDTGALGANSDAAMEGAEFVSVYYSKMKGGTLDGTAGKTRTFFVYGRQDTGVMRVMIKSVFRTFWTDNDG